MVSAVNARLCWKTIKLDWRCVVQHATLSKKMLMLFKTYPKKLDDFVHKEAIFELVRDRNKQVLIDLFCQILFCFVS